MWDPTHAPVHQDGGGRGATYVSDSMLCSYSPNTSQVISVCVVLSGTMYLIYKPQKSDSKETKKTIQFFSSQIFI